MSGNNSYTDGIPVKISEKYKPPKEIKLTTHLIQQLSRKQVDPVAFEDYNFDLERKIISKTSEWINYRLKERTERQERIHQRDADRIKRLEQEQKEKLNRVSYPSADEFTSSCDEEDEEADNKLNEARHSKARNHHHHHQGIPSEKLFSENFNSNAILKPTQAQPDIVINKTSHRRYASNSSNKIDFSFFESDASPFDNLEMKSMNEMEELAKVLQSTAVDSSESANANVLERNNSSENELDEHDSSEKSYITHNNNNNIDQINSAVVAAAHSVQQPMYNHYNFYGTPSENNQAFQRSNTQFSAATSTYQLYNQHLPNNCYFTQNYAANFTHATNPLNNNNSACENLSDKTENENQSVPNIIKELNIELNNSERRRIRNNSQNSHKIVTTTEQIESKLNILRESTLKMCYYLFSQFIFSPNTNTTAVRL